MPAPKVHLPFPSLSPPPSLPLVSLPPCFLEKKRWKRRASRGWQCRVPLGRVAAGSCSTRSSAAAEPLGLGASLCTPEFSPSPDPLASLQHPPPRPASFKPASLPRWRPSPDQQPPNQQPSPNQHLLNEHPLPKPASPPDQRPSRTGVPPEPAPLPNQHPAKQDPSPHQHPPNQQPSLNQHLLTEQPSPNPHPPRPAPLPRSWPSLGGPPAPRSSHVSGCVSGGDSPALSAAAWLLH